MKLTPAQEAKIPEYVDRYVRIGLATDHITQEKAEKYLKPFYEKVIKKPLPRIIIAPSPLAAWDQVRDQVEDPYTKDQVRDQVKMTVTDETWHLINGDHIGAQVRGQVGAQVRGQVVNQVKEQVGNQIRGQAKEQVEDFLWPYLEGQFDAFWGAWYAYYHEMGVKFACPAKEYHDLIHLSLIYPLKHVVVLSDKPAEIHRNEDGLHNPQGPAVLYRDGYSVYALHGVRMQKEYVETPAEKIDPVVVVKEENAEVRRELVRKIGIERLCQKIGHKVLDKGGDYELLRLNIPDIEAVYLKMRNPSIGVWHLEGVHPNIKTINEALAWRDGEEKYIKPSQLT